MNEYHGSESNPTTSDQLMLGTNHNFHFDFRIIKRDWLLSDFTLFSDFSLNYLQPIELRQQQDIGRFAALNLTG